MTEKQPEALRLANALNELDAQFSFPGLCGDAAAELRRLHELHVLYQDKVERLEKLCYDYLGELTAMRAAKQMQQKIDDLRGAQRQWVGLEPKDMTALVEQARQVPKEVPCPDYNERLLNLADAKLREKNAA